MPNKEQHQITEVSQDSLSAIIDRTGFTLEKFLLAIREIGESRPNSVSENLPPIEQITQDNDAFQFFLQAEPKEDKSNQASVDKLCQAKLRLIACEAVTWQNIQEIDSPEHPLLNRFAISRMDRMGIIVPTTLEEEIRYWRERAGLLNETLELLYVFYKSAIFSEMSRLKESSINAYDKYQNVKNWYNAAQAAVADIPIQEKFSFYKRFRIKIGEKEKSIKEIFKKSRFSSTKLPKSYTRITKIESILNKYQIQLRFTIHSQQELENIQAELRWEIIALIKDPGERVTALDNFHDAYPGFEAGRLQASAFIFRPKTLADLLAQLKDIPIRWSNVRTIINDYYQNKGVTRSQYAVEDWSLFFVSLTCNVSPLVQKLDKFAAESHGIGELRPELVLNDEQKREIIVEIHQHIHSLGYNKKGKELSESGRTAAKLLHLLFGLGMDFGLTEFSDFKAKEMLDFLYRIGPSSTAQDHIEQESLESGGQHSASSASLVSSLEPSKESNLIEQESLRSGHQHPASSTSVISSQEPLGSNPLSSDVIAILPVINSLTT